MASLLELKSISKHFGGVQALQDITLTLSPGQCLGLIGENGAGKSTLIKIISGVELPDQGYLVWEGQPWAVRSPHDAQRLGIATIHQELSYFQHLTVAENLLMGQPWPRKPWGSIDWKELNAEAKRILKNYQSRVEPERLFSKLSAAEKQEVAIARALSQKAKLLILDEPTASLTGVESARLFDQIKSLQKEGVAILYISHRLHEILQLTDEVVILRDGQLMRRMPTADATTTSLVKDMVGRSLDHIYPRHRKPQKAKTVLEVEGLTQEGMFKDIGFKLHEGEIVGMAGLMGAGRSEIARALYGLYPYQHGTVKLFGQPSPKGDPKAVVRRGMIYLPEERKRQGIVAEHGVGDSISIGFSDLISEFGLIFERNEDPKVNRAMETYGIRAYNSDQPIGQLSGGNQQKALLARWLERAPLILLLDEPTRGVDVASKAEIHEIIDNLTIAGNSILLISSDLPELIGMSDRVLVVHEGQITAELSGSDLTEERILSAASGIISP